MTRNELRKAAGKLREFLKPHRAHLGRPEVQLLVEKYVTGCLSDTHKKNAEAIALEVGDGRLDVPGHAGVTTQGFALVISGALEDAAPPPVPDGTVGTAMTASRSGADEIDVAWDVSTCDAASYHLIHGALGMVASHATEGAACDLTGSGSYRWSGVPPGDLWFVVVADDGLGLEGTWGLQADGTHRGGTAPSEACGHGRRDNSGTCVSP